VSEDVNVKEIGGEEWKKNVRGNRENKLRIKIGELVVVMVFVYP
jgi:hypothetical protein